MSQQLKEAVTRIKAGDKETGRRMLVQFLKANPNSEMGWLWLAGVTRDLHRQKQYLQKVLTLNPQNGHARKRLDQLEERELLFEGLDFAEPPSPAPIPYSQNPPPQKHKNRRGCMSIIMVIGLFLCLCGIISSLMPDFDDSSPGSTSSTDNTPVPAGPTSTPKPDLFGAYFICKEFVYDRLKAPTTAEFGDYVKSNVDYLGNNEYLTVNYVDSQNGFGAMIRTHYVCTVRLDQQQEKWFLLDLQTD